MTPRLHLRRYRVSTTKPVRASRRVNPIRQPQTLTNILHQPRPEISTQRRIRHLQRQIITMTTSERAPRHLHRRLLTVILYHPPTRTLIILRSRSLPQLTCLPIHATKNLRYIINILIRRTPRHEYMSPVWPIRHTMIPPQHFRTQRLIILTRRITPIPTPRSIQQLQQRTRRQKRSPHHLHLKRLQLLTLIQPNLTLRKRRLSQHLTHHVHHRTQILLQRHRRKRHRRYRRLRPRVSTIKIHNLRYLPRTMTPRASRQ